MEKNKLKERLVELGIDFCSPNQCFLCGGIGLTCLDLSQAVGAPQGKGLPTVYVCFDCLRETVPVAMDVFREEYREGLAAVAHDIWSHWMAYLLPHVNDGLETCQKYGNISQVTRQLVERWNRQMETPYPQLSEGEKNSDREQAEKIMKALGGGQRDPVERRFVGEGSFTSARIETVGPHDKVRLWNRGGLAGELVLNRGDGVPMLEALGLKKEKENGEEHRTDGRVPIEGS